MERRAIAPDESTPAGTAAEVIAAAAGTHSTTIRYWTYAGSQTPHDSELTLEVTADEGSAEFVVKEAVKETDVSCPTRVEMDASLRFVSADGAFDETISGKLFGAQGSAQLDGSLTPAELRGSYDAEPIAKLYVAPTLDFQARFRESVSGDIDMSGGDPDDDPNTQIVSAAIAQWPGAAY